MYAMNFLTLGIYMSPRNFCLAVKMGRDIPGEHGDTFAHSLLPGEAPDVGQTSVCGGLQPALP
jgi:hypothetical protein